MRIVSLIENTASTEKLRAEHGLSLYIEHNGEKILMDTGAGSAFMDNARRMGIDLAGVKKVVISHNHNDHTGGLEPLLKRKKDITVYAKKAALDDFFCKAGFIKVPISQIKQLYKRYPDNFVFYNKFTEITKGFYMVTNEVEDKSMYCQSKQLYMKREGRFVHDEYRHEAFAVVFPKEDERKGCVIISSCSHCGIVNILNTVRSLWKGVPVLAVIGGFHLMGSSTKKLCCTAEFVQKTVQEIKKMDIGSIFTCHCTGLKGYELLKSGLKDQIQYFQTGEELLF